MPEQQSEAHRAPSPVRRFHGADRVASAAVIALGIVGLLGWFLDIGVLKSGIPGGSETMKPNTAVAFVLAGTSLALQLERGLVPPRWWLARACAIGALGVGVLTVAEYAFTLDLGIDRLLLRHTASDASAPSPGRMAPNTASCFVFLGAALCWHDATIRWLRATLETLTTVVLLVAYVAICGYVFSASALYGVAGYSSMAPHTALGFAVLAIGVLASRPERGLVQIVAQDTPAGASIRRLLPLLIAIPLGVSWVRLQGQHAGYYGTEFGLALMVTVTTSVLVALALLNARVQGATDRARQQALLDERFSSSLGELLRNSLSSSDVLFEASKMLGEYLKASRSLFVQVDSPNDRVTIERDYRDRLPSLSGVRPMSSFSPETLVEARSGRTVVVADASIDRRTAAQYAAVYGPLSIRGRVAVPLMRDGEWVSLFLVTTHAPRIWQEREIRLIESVAERTWVWFEHLQSLEALHRQEQDLTVTMNSIGEAIVTTDACGRVVRMNPVAERLTGWALSVAARKSVSEVVRILDGDTRAPADLEWERVLREGTSLVSSRSLLVSRDGSELPITESLAPIRAADGAIQGAVLVFRDASLERAAELAQKASEARFRLAIEAAPNGMLLVDEAGTIVLVNAQVEKVFGYTREELFGKSVELLVPERFRKPHAAHRAGFFQSPSSRSMGLQRDLFGVRKDGSEVPIEVALSPLQTPEGTFVLISVVDITDRKRSAKERDALLSELRALNASLEERVASRTFELSASLKERETLLQEVHHRVKNNLQVISSLINLQVRQLNHPAARSALEECQTRVQAIALIHEQLYQSKNYADIPFSEYAANLAQNVFHAADVSPLAVKLELSFEALSLAVDKAIPCGLILNELITNALKHAFPDGRRGSIRVALRTNSEAVIVLSVADDGVGLPASFALHKSNSLGLQLVSTLVEQLDGKLEVVRDQGTRFVITFPCEARQ